MSYKNDSKINLNMDNVIELFKTFQNDSINNGVNMFNAHEPLVNSNNMLNHFHQFIKKYISVVKNTDEIINIT